MITTARMERIGAWPGFTLATTLFLILVTSAWIGFLGSDDVTYARGAYGWIEQFPYVGGHGTIRYPLTIPMALSFLTFGDNEIAMVLPSLLYLLGFLALAWFLVREVAGQAAAFVAMAALATTPLLVINASVAGVDVVELFFLFASFLLFWRAAETGVSRTRLLVSGVAAGCAFLTRETAIFIAIFYAPLFLLGYRLPRTQYLWIAVGFLGVWAAELLYLSALTGNPLYRLGISLNHDASINRSVDLAGNALIHPAIDPLMVLLLNQEFMALFVFAIPLGAWLCFTVGAEPTLRRFARLVAWFGVSWFLCTGAAQTLLPLNPRYFIISTAAACILIGLALWHLASNYGRRGRLIAAAAFAVLIGTNLLGISVENKDSMFGERTLAKLANADASAIIVTDPMTRYRADLLLQWTGAEKRVLDNPPRPGDLYFHNPKHAGSANFKMPASAIQDFRPDRAWTVVASFRPTVSVVARVLTAFELDTKLPPAIWHKLSERHPPVVVYKVS